MAKDKQPNLTKTCSSCGQQKSLSAFLQMSGTKHGTAYGNICADCRKTAKEMASKRKKTEAEGSTTSETGHRINSKTKVHESQTRREEHERSEEEYHEERDIDETVEDKKLEKRKDIKSKERKHRETFLNQARKQPAGYDKKAADKFAAAEEKYGQELVNEEIAEQAHSTHETHKKTKHDFRVTFHGQQIAGQIRFSGQIFQQFRQWLGNSAPIVRNLSQTGKTAGAKQAGSIAQPFGQTLEANKQAKTAANKTPAQSTSRTGLLSGSGQQGGEKKGMAEQYVNKNWRPGSKR